MDKYFRDDVREATTELKKKAIITCNNNGCSWKGSSKDHQEHIHDCKFATAFCPYLGQANELEEHCTTSTKKCFQQQLMALSQQISDFKSQIDHVHREIFVTMQDVVSAVNKAEVAIQNLQEKFADQATIVQSTKQEDMKPFEECNSDFPLEPGVLSQAIEQDMSGVYHGKNELVFNKSIKFPSEMSVSYFMSHKH